MKGLPSLFFMVCLSSICLAKTEYRHASGDCDGHSVGWWSTSRYDNGRLVETWGMDCNGREYHTFGRTITLHGPLAGNPTETGVCEGSPAGGVWYAATMRNTIGIASEVWGKDCNGQYWQFIVESSRVIPGGRGLSQSDMRTDERPRYEQVPMHTEPMRTGKAPGRARESGIK